MRRLLLSLVILVGISGLLPASTLEGDERSVEAILSDVDGVQAVAIANEWKWTKKEIKSYATSEGVIFILPNRRTIAIPFPEDKMLVSVAPYINRTHR